MMKEVGQGVVYRIEDIDAAFKTECIKNTVLLELPMAKDKPFDLFKPYEFTVAIFFKRYYIK